MEEEENDHCRERCGESPGHKVVPRGAVPPDECLQADLNRPVLVRIRDEERPEEVIPGEEETEDCKGRERRTGQWDDNPTEDGQSTTSIDARRFLQLNGY